MRAVMQPDSDKRTIGGFHLLELQGCYPTVHDDTSQ